MDERSSLGTVSKRERFFRNARARNTHVEATLNLSCPAQVELELVAPPGIDGLEGFLITASKGFVRAADLNGQRSDCTHGGVTHVPTPSKKRKYTVDFGLPHKYGDVDLKVVALAGSREWYESTLHFYVGEEEADAATHKSRSSRQMILILVVVCATLGTTLYVGISSWPTEAPHRQKWQ